MAPMTRRSQANAGVTKKAHRKQSAQAPAVRKQTSDSWELLDREGLNGHAHEDAPDNEDEHTGQLAIDGPLDVESAVGPLREMADKIGTEVEMFAVALDRMLEMLPERRENKLEWADQAINELGDTLHYRIQELNRTHGAGRAAQAQKDWVERARLSGSAQPPAQKSLLKSSLLGEKKEEQVEHLRDLQQEYGLWHLLKTMLELRPFEDEAEQERQERKQKLQKMGPAHRYTSEDELWERFELSNEVAVERRKVRRWLEHMADNQGSNMVDIVAELENKAGKGKGLWTSGWMHTREKIKGEKRLRDWPIDADARPPQIRRTGDDDLLVARLDPDAMTRQGRALESSDAYFERAIWIACWEMLRRGKSWEEICQWCEERKEGWRAFCLGFAADTADHGSSRLAWRHLCRVAAQGGCSSDHEAAIFGLLGGDEESVKKTCRSVDDRLYAFYNSKLLRAFDSFVLTQFPDSVSLAQWNRKIDANALETPGQGAAATSALLARLRKEPATRQEMLQPMKIIQSYILADEVVSLLNTVGVMVGETARAQGAEGVIFFRSRKPVDVNEQTGERDVALDAQTLRMMAHVAIIFRVLRLEPLEGDDLLEDDNILVAYIQNLRIAGKRDPIPMYASRLHEDRAVKVMGRVLQDVSEGAEQSSMLSLLGKYNLDVIAILTEQMNIVFEASFAGRRPSQKPLRILERTTETKMHPGQRIIAGFLSDEVTHGDEALVTALQWFQLHRGHWAVTFKSLTEALMRCLLHGNLPGARLIVQTFPHETISLRKSYETLGVAMNLMDTSEAPRPVDKHERLTRDLMQRQSRTYFELEQLVRAIEALADWRSEEDKYIGKAPQHSTVPQSLKKAKTAVTEAMDPVIKGILLHPRDVQEGDDLRFIRDLYIPEVVIAYNTVLHAAGNLITREALLESMDLSVAVAHDEATEAGQDGEVGAEKSKPDANGLLECFQRSGRMRELVTSFALTGKAMLVLKAEGKPWKSRKDREGKELGIWEIGAGAATEAA